MGVLELAAGIAALLNAATKAAELLRVIHAEGRTTTPAEDAAIWATIDKDTPAAKAVLDAAIKRHGG